MRPYAQLTQEQRYQIYAFLKAGFSQSAVSFEIGVHKSTISRELRRIIEMGSIAMFQECVKLLFVNNTKNRSIFGQGRHADQMGRHKP